jgi:N-methylhydantoinase A
MHERLYAIKDEEDTVEFTTWKVSAIGSSRAPARIRSDDSIACDAGMDGREAAPREHRKVYVHQAGGAVPVPIFDGDSLAAGDTVAGPCVIEEATTTIFLLPGMRTLVNGYGDYEVTVE